MKPFSYLRPRSLEEAEVFLQKHGAQAKIIAGGTDLFVQMKKGISSPRYLIDIASIPELQKIEFNKPDGLTIGAATCLTEIENSGVVRSQWAMIAEAAAMIGSVQIRHLGTIGGNICNASPSADLAPPLIALKGKVEILTPNGFYWKDLEEFFKGPGQTVLQASDMVTQFLVPISPSSMRGLYLKEGRTRGMDLAIAGVAMTLSMKNGGLCDDASIAIGAVAPMPLRVKAAENILKGQKIVPDLIKKACQICAKACQPITDVRASADYRRRLVQVLVQRALMRLVAEKGGQG